MLCFLVYNLPSIVAAANWTAATNGSGALTPPTLILTRSTLVDIFLGSITRWNDPRLLTMNPWLDSYCQLAALTFSRNCDPIQVVVRSDSSGTVNVFTSSLSAFSSTWASLIGFGDSVTWSNTNISSSNLKFAYLTQGMAEAIAAQMFSIGFLALSEATSFGLPIASMVNRAGVTVAPTTSSVQFAIMDLGSVCQLHSFVFSSLSSSFLSAL